MDRRSFLRLGVSTSVVGLISGVTACGKTQSSLPTIIPTPFPLVVNTSMYGWLDYLATLLAIPLIANSIHSFLPQLQPQDKNTVNKVNERMRRNNFSGFDQASVYGKDDFFYYTVEGPNSNTCTPLFIYGNSREAALLEGPATLGMVWGVRDYLKAGAPVADTKRLFIPRQTEQEALGLFDKSYKNPGIYQTEGGRLMVNYTKQQPDSGLISVSATQSQGGILFDQTYQVQI